MEEKLMNQKHLPPKKRCSAMAFPEPETEHEPETSPPTKHLPLKKRCYAVAFSVSKPEPETKTETSPRTKQFCFETKHKPEVETKVKTEENLKPNKVMLFGVDISRPPTVKQLCPVPLTSKIKSQKSQNLKQPIEEKKLPDALLSHIKSRLGGDQEVSQVKFIMEKKMEYSDIVSGHSRLSIPGAKINNTKFLTKHEEGWLKRKNNKGKSNRLRVKVFGSSLLKERELNLTRWNYASKGYRYVLNRKWMHFQKENNLEEGQMIQLWSFRHKDRVCFAIVGLEKEKKIISPIQSYFAGLTWKTRPRSSRVHVDKSRYLARPRKIY